MFLTKKYLSRRTVLKGAGVAISLPLLDAMMSAVTVSDGAVFTIGDGRAA
jgi:hypothetical protein